jgi:hypothetical protein
MKDILDNELKVDDYVAISSNVSTAAQEIEFGKVDKLLPKSVNVAISNRRYGGMDIFNVRASARLLRIAANTIPWNIRDSMEVKT